MRIIALLALCFSTTLLAETNYQTTESSFKTLLKAMVEADTTNPPGNEARLVKVVAERLKKAGIPYEITEFEKGRENIIARLKGDGTLKPLMIMAHIDVVGTQDQTWSVANPHTVTEKDGFLYGRGVMDDLGMAAAGVEILVLIKESGVALKRDIILALTGDEEVDGKGLLYLLDKRPELIDAGVVLNEGGGFSLGENGKVKLANLQLAEKTYQDFIITAKGETGHSSVPLKDNAIYKLSAALSKIEKHKFPIRLIPVTRGYLKERATSEKEPLRSAMLQLANAKGSKLPANALKVIEASLAFSTLLRTTCVATMLKGGTKENALPANATANLNCRMLPDETSEQVQKELERVIGSKDIEIKVTDRAKAAPPSPTEGEMVTAIKKVSKQMWPDVPIIPNMGRGATDSKPLRERGISAYGLVPFAISEADGKRMHGIDERLPVASIKPGLEFLHRLVLDLASKK